MSLRNIALMIALLAIGCSASVCPELRGSRIQRDWLVRRVSIAEAEQEHMSRGLAFGAQNARWQRLKSAFRPGDQLWLYARKYPPSPSEDQGVPVGAEIGYALVRDCEVVDSIVTLIS